MVSKEAPIKSVEWGIVVVVDDDNTEEEDDDNTEDDDDNTEDDDDNNTEPDIGDKDDSFVVSFLSSSLLLSSFNVVSSCAG